MKNKAVRLSVPEKDGVRTQFGALCYRVQNDKVQILLVTSRGTGRWVIPKGWPVDGATPAESAATEAYEEAGAVGKVAGHALGIFSYVKSFDKSDDLPCVVAVFPLKVKSLLDDFPEVKSRNRKWFSKKKAIALVNEPELRQMIYHFDPSQSQR